MEEIHKQFIEWLRNHSLYEECKRECCQYLGVELNRYLLIVDRVREAESPWITYASGFFNITNSLQDEWNQIETDYHEKCYRVK